MNRLTPDADDTRFIRRVLWLILIVASITALYLARHLLILAFGSMLIAIVIHAIADIYAKHLHAGSRHSLGLAIVTLSRIPFSARPSSASLAKGP